MSSPAESPETAPLARRARHAAVPPGRRHDLSAARFTIVAAAVLPQCNPTPEVSQELTDLLTPGHRLVEIGEEAAQRRSSCHAIRSLVEFAAAAASGSQ